MVHLVVFNKNEFTGLLKSSKGRNVSPDRNASAWHQDLIKSRSHVILLGDSPGDIQMGDGIDHEVMLSIGLLNRYSRTVDKQWTVVGGDAGEHPAEAPDVAKDYMDRFDIVLCGDMGFDVWVNYLLKAITSAEMET